MSMKKSIPYFLFVFLIWNVVWAEDPQDIEFIPISQSLTQNTVTRIVQDQKGFLWIGTRNGLNKYDGVNMVSYEFDDSDSTSVSGGYITAICEDHEGVLWIGTFEGGLNRYDKDTDTFVQYRHDEDDLTSISQNQVTAIYEDDQGVLWIGTHQSGLNRLDQSRKEFKRFKKNQDDPFSISSNAIREINGDDEGNLWVSTWENGMNLYNKSSNRFIQYHHDPNDPTSLKSDITRSLAPGKNNDYWVGTNGGLCRLYYDDGGKYTFEEIDFENTISGQEFNVVLSVMEDSQNRIWIGTENGGLIVHNLVTGHSKKFTYDPSKEFGIKSNSIWSLFEDNRGFIWVGTFNKGLFKVDPDHYKFKHIKQSPTNINSLSDNSVSSFAEDEFNNIWIGTDGGGLNYWNTSNNTFKHYNTTLNSDFPSNQVLSTVLDSNGNLWISFWQGGVRVLKKGSDKFEKIYGGKNETLNSADIFSLMQDSKGRIWLAGFGSGLTLYDPTNESLQEFKNDEFDSLSLSHNFVRFIYEDSDGFLWVGTHAGGLNKVIEKEGKFTFQRYLKSLNEEGKISSDITISMLEDSKKNLWIGTGSKLNRYDKQSGIFKSYGKRNGLPNEVIYGILEDEMGNIWVGTNKGLAMFDVERESFRSYGILDGLQADEFFKQSCLKRKNGEMLFGGINGFNIFNPAEVKDNTYSPDVYISEFSISNSVIKPSEDSPLKKSVMETSKIELNHSQNDFSFEFAVLSFSQSTANQYAYQLVNYDADWQHVGNRRNAYYTNVPQGDYTFRVKATNNDGKWSENMASIDIHITPAWYNTYWAYGIYGLIFLFGLMLGFRLIIMRERLQTKYKVDHMELSKMQELDELKSRFFANISHEFRSPLTLILGPLKTLRERAKSNEDKEEAGIMIRNAESLLNLINELLELSKLESGKMKLEASKDDVVEFLRPIIKSFAPLADKNYISYKIDLPFEPVELYFDKPKLEKIVVNLLSNAFKYTPEFGKVGFVVKEEFGTLKIEVSDSGIGIPQDEAEFIFNRYYRVNNKTQSRNKGTGIGLSLTKELVELHKGKINVKSAEGKGTAFKVLLPLGKNHLQEDEIVDVFLEYKPDLQKFFENEEKLADVTSDQKSNEFEEMVEGLPVILVIDDNEEIRKYIRQTLNLEYRTIEAVDGTKGVALAKKSIPDLIISDVMMPGVDGYQVCEELKQDVKTSHIPIILLTAKASNESAMKGFEIGADYYITKPFDPKLLAIRVGNMLKTRNQIREQLVNRNTLNIEPSDIKITPKDQDFLNEAIAIVEKNMSNSEFYVDDLGKEMGLSRMQLYRKLKGLIGQSANEFVRSIRLKRAAQLLRQGDKTISEITYEVGFNDLQYFRDCFKKQFGVNPSAYLEKADNIS